ncbi:hypothetical protein O1L55_20660 [Streptomyces albulus]|nr:hypothetical protein [Streptomyces noursei]
MAELNAKARKKLPKSDFGQPSKKAYPMQDKAHAANAKARASQEVNKGKLTETAEKQIDAKANKILGEKNGKPTASTKARAAVVDGKTDKLLGTDSPQAAATRKAAIQSFNSGAAKKVGKPTPNDMPKKRTVPPMKKATKKK